MSAFIAFTFNQYSSLQQDVLKTLLVIPHCVVPNCYYFARVLPVV